MKCRRFHAVANIFAIQQMNTKTEVENEHKDLLSLCVDQIMKSCKLDKESVQ